MSGKKHEAFPVRITAEGTGHKEGYGDTSAKPIFCTKPVRPVQGGVTVCHTVAQRPAKKRPGDTGGTHTATEMENELLQNFLSAVGRRRSPVD